MVTSRVIRNVVLLLPLVLPVLASACGGDEGASGASSPPRDAASGGAAHEGDATWYNTGLGACGVTNDDSQLIAALAIPDFDPSTPDGNPNHNTLCGKTATVCQAAKCVTVTIEDRCVGCKEGDIDLSPTAFRALAPLDAGRIRVTWSLD
jgi:expansin (peptidoglycan-binding protein)